MIPLYLMLMTAVHIQNICWVSMNNNQTNLFGRVYHFTFRLQQINMNPSSHCKTSIFEEEFKFQYVRRDILIHIVTKNIILTWHFSCQSGTFPVKVNMEVSSNIWNKNTFCATSLSALGVHRQFQRRRLLNWICSTVKLKLKSS